MKTILPKTVDRKMWLLYANEINSSFFWIYKIVWFILLQNINVNIILYFFFCSHLTGGASIPFGHMCLHHPPCYYQVTKTNSLPYSAHHVWLYGNGKQDFFCTYSFFILFLLWAIYGGLVKWSAAKGDGDLIYFIWKSHIKARKLNKLLYLICYEDEKKWIL